MDDTHGWEWPDIGAFPVKCSYCCSGKVDGAVRREEEGTSGAVIDFGFSSFPYAPSLILVLAEGPREVPTIPRVGNPGTQLGKSCQCRIRMHCHAAGAGINVRGGS